METFRLDLMAMEVRLGTFVKEHSDRVVAALDRHGAKLDESGADLRRSNIAMAAALERQAERMDLLEAILNRLVNATLFQEDVRPLIHGFEAVVKSARVDPRAAADAAREAVEAANQTKEAVKQAVAAAPLTKAAPGYTDWQYWWSWWQASWHTPLSVFFLGFGIYQAESRAHIVVMGFFFSPYLSGVALFVIFMRRVLPQGEALDTADPLRQVPLFSLGRRRRTSRSGVSPSSRCPGGGSHGALYHERVGTGHDHRACRILGIRQGLVEPLFSVQPSWGSQQLHRVVCVGSSCNNVVKQHQSAPDS
jgi:hypothetical protein